ncbi:MAG: hypothetical protein Q7W45_16385 [Bacteroidota bacterium]|nr:hypothetical protein [Bacteroidota bacterium]MDP3145405.1 hypothetical protein [Bacteroidota bacterium]
MERREEIKVRSGKEYDHLFPRAMLTSITKKQGATVADTIKFIPTVVRDTLFHTEKIAKVLKGDNIRETCSNIWHFVYDHIAYKKDEDGKEQVRSPARAWHDRGNIQGVDCDCYTVFISSILSNLNIRHKLRITKYKEDRFQHIYPIVPLSDGSYITIDCVVRNFDYEEPYSEKKDTNMDLEYLNGLSEASNYKNNTDSLDLVGIFDDGQAMADLGKLFRRKAKSGGGSEGGGGKKKGKFKAILKKGLHLTNILNPATATIRAGVLLSAKLNVMKIGERLKWSYLTEEAAKSKGIDMGKFAKLKRIREKLDKIFYGMGGKPENLKKAILTGKGNKNKEVNGLGAGYDPLDGLDETSDASAILGTDMYHDELSGVEDDFGELGVVTATAIASATGVIGAIAALLKSVGNIFPKKGKEGEGSGGEGAGSEESGGGSSSEEGGGSSDEDSGGNTKNKKSGSSGGGSDGDDDSGNDSNIKGKSKSKEKDNPEDDKPEGFWDKNKKWIKPVAIGVGSLGLLFAGYKIVTHKKVEPAQPAQPTLTGVPRSKKKHKHKKHKHLKSKKHKKEAVALL